MRSLEIINGPGYPHAMERIQAALSESFFRNREGPVILQK